MLNKMEKTEFRVLIKHCFLMGKNTVQTKHWLEKCYGNDSPSKTTICRWFADFKRGRTDTKDAERLGRPNMIMETKFPLNKIRAIMKSASCDTGLISNEVLFLVTKSTELFVQYLCEQTYKCIPDNTIEVLEYKHLNDVVQNNRNLKFIVKEKPLKIKS